MAGFSLTTCATGLVIFFSVCYLQPPAPVAALSFNYSNFSSNNQNIEIEGKASIRVGYIDISANDARDIFTSAGRVSYKTPVQLWDAATGELHHNLLLQHLVDSASPTSPTPTSPPARTGPVRRLVAVEFDTYLNRDFDPNATYDHIGIDVNSIVSVTNESLPDFSLNGSMTATVDYNSSSSILSVKLWINDTTKPPYNLSDKVDLKSALPEKVTIGFSAATGASVELHQLTSWYFNSSPSFEHKHGRAGVEAGATVGATLFVVLLFTVAAILIRRRRIKNRKEAEDEQDISSDSLDDDGEPIVEIEMGTGPRRFPYYELVEATKSFAAEEKLGQGGFGAVYRGYLREQGLAVAIKRFAKDSSKQGRKEYKSEIKVISRLRHRNLVQLIGWCHGRDELLLIYELVPNRSLDIHLHGNGTFLTWPMRVKIVLGIGSALFYLHEEWGQCVVHRDIKPSNVMLDEFFNAKLGDFGLARFIDHTVGMRTMTAVSGTPGYVDPECLITGRASVKSDVYSFGIVLLEVACGRKPMSLLDSQTDGVFRLVEWAWDLYGKGDVLKVVDVRLNDDYDVTEMERVIVLGLWCAHPDPSARPSIRDAMAILQSSGG
uniref:non-specific serine/threonine protein kinase n=1 Tax=Oryza rufipogon TaxID=4529 RepID=A0A0E0QDT6_ORYRU